MRNIRTAFEEFWGGFYNRSTQLPSPLPIKAYQSGFVVEYGGQPTPQNPEGAKIPPLPYITFDISRPPFGDFAIVTGRIWTRSTSFGLVDDVLAQAEKKIPEGGAGLDLGADGAVILYRSNPFIQYMTPEDDDPLNKTGVISVIMKNYVL